MRGFFKEHKWIFRKPNPPGLRPGGTAIINMKVKQIFLFAISVLVFFLTCPAQSGGQYTVTQSVIAGGGTTNSAGSSFAVAGTSGQPVAGQRATGILYSQHAGFWMDDGVAVSSMVSVNGQVQTVDGAGIRNVTVTIKDGNGFSQSAVSSAFGFYSFQNVPVGGSYTLTVTSRKFRFALTQISVSAQVDNLILYGLE